MTRTEGGPSIRQARPTGRAPRPRDSLFAATMLVPVAVIAMLAAGKLASRRIGHSPVARETHPQQQLAAVPPDPSVAEPAKAPARSPGDSTASTTDVPHADHAPAPPDLRSEDRRDALASDESLLRRDPGNVELRRADVDAARQAEERRTAEALNREPQQARALRRQQRGYVNSDANERAPARGGIPGDADEGMSSWSAPGTAAPARDTEVARRTSSDPTSLAYPPAPFMPEERTARGTAPRYRPVLAANDYPYRPVLDTTPFGLPAPTAQSTAQVPQHGDRAANQPDEPDMSFGLPSDIGIPARLVPEPLTAEVNREGATLHPEVAPSVQAGVGLRSRSGEPGIDRLIELATPLEAEFSAAGFGRVKLAATPTALEAGSIGHDTANLQRFGSGALGLVPTVAGFAYSGASPSDQRADGVGLAASYTLGPLAADVGTTPLGFPITHIVGGLAFAPQITDALRLRLTGERRALTDSVLSYAGTRDARTGTLWGGEVRTRGRADIEFGIGSGRGYIGAGGGAITGIRTVSNSEAEFGAGASFPIYRRDSQSLNVGLDLAYFSYRRNLRFFTLGQGGYFSPQSYVAAMVPIQYKEQVSEDLSYEVGASIGVQSYHENASPYYPRDPALQMQLVAIQTDPTKAGAGVRTTYAADNRTGFAGNGHASVDYRITPNLHLGARAGILRAGNFTEASGVAYARYVFSGTDMK